jgi:trans-2,3-dihydro-3-hydroxyanthranilate isomerase
MARFFILDVFAEQRFAGNPLAVVLGDGWAAETMQDVAREMAYSETTFVGSPDASRGWPVRIFTPEVEVPFAGHPTIGTASVIRERLQDTPSDEVTLQLAVGDVAVRFASDGVAWMRSPEPRIGPERDAGLVAAVLGLQPEDLDTRFPVQEVSTGIAFTLIPLRNLDALARAHYRPGVAQTLREQGGSTALFLFTPETLDPDHQIHARMFAPDYGVAEDPATGSANACLAGYIRHQRYPGHDRSEIRVEQGYQIKRPSLLRLRVGDRPEIGGRVLFVAEGEIAL